MTLLHQFIFLILFLLNLPSSNGDEWKKRKSNRRTETTSVNKKDLNRYADCSEVRKYGGYTGDGIYTIWMNATHSFDIYCIHEENNSYNVILKRSSPYIAFNQGWQAYVYGFGNPQSDYWAGLNQMYYLTSIQKNTILTVQLQDWAGNNRNARYSFFQVDNSPSYTLRIGGYYGDAGDSMSQNNNMPFATPDKPDHNYCAYHQQGGWWFNYCTFAFPTGKYYVGGPYTPSGTYYDGIYWYTWGGYGYSMKLTQMMVSNS